MKIGEQYLQSEHASKDDWTTKEIFFTNKYGANQSKKVVCEWVRDI